jgi:hypothetical protein
MIILHFLKKTFSESIFGIFRHLETLSPFLRHSFKVCFSSPNQGCQMEYLHTKKQFGMFWKGPAKKDDFRSITAKNADRKRFFSNFVGLAPYP